MTLEGELQSYETLTHSLKYGTLSGERLSKKRSEKSQNCSFSFKIFYFYSSLIADLGYEPE